MTRLATTIDRLAALTFGLALIAVGVGLLVWNTQWIPGTPKLITAPGLVSASETHWWPWASAGVGVLLVVIAGRWIFAHTPKARIKNWRLGSGELGIVSADLDEVSAAAARALQEYPEVTSAKGRAVVDRGTRTIDLDATAQSSTTLSSLIESIDAVCGQLSSVLGDTPVCCRTRIHVDKHPRRARVE